jgi:hypothetical protein
MSFALHTTDMTFSNILTTSYIFRLSLCNNTKEDAKMVSAGALILLAILVYWICSSVLGLRRNISAAKRSGLPYVVTRE